METTRKKAFNIVGIAIRTSNNNGEAARDIPELWAKFWAENVMAEIPNRTDDTIYCVYTNYDGDYTKPYTTILGCRVNSIGHVPDELISLSIPAAEYAAFSAKGDLMKGIVFNKWTEIWNSDLNRAYTADFEVYGEKTKQMDNAEVDIFIALK